MSPASVSNFVGDLVAMATAFEKLPQVEAELAQTHSLCGQLAETIQQREEAILRYKAEIESLQSTLRALEVARDDAQFHALEADDRTQRALDFIKATFGNAGTLIQALEPPAAAIPEPSPAPVPVQAVPEAPAEVTAEPATVSEPIPFSDWLPDPALANHSAPEVAPMQASPLPNASDTLAPASAETASPTSNVGAGSEPIATEPFSMPPIAKGKYHGMTYSEAKNAEGFAFSWPNKDEWLAGGGSLDNFYA